MSRSRVVNEGCLVIKTNTSDDSKATTLVTLTLTLVHHEVDHSVLCYFLVIHKVL